MKWSKMWKKAGLGALLAGVAAFIPVLTEAGALSAINWDRALIPVIAAGLGALVTGGNNYWKHRDGEEPADAS